jgi:MoaA/NifB/PqqE/SkfB family radical SAM enzyme
MNKGNKTMIRIVNWLLTRKCNLKCDYCAIVKNYDGMPEEYPDMKHYHKNEMSTVDVIEALKKFKLHNPDMFHIWYGGEPMLRKDLVSIIEFCNTQDIHYTIISNNTEEIQPMIKNLIDNCTEIKGFTASVDPVLVRKCTNVDRIRKSHQGFNSLLELKKHIKDIVAEITVMKEDVDSLYHVVKMLSNNGINSDITFIDIAKSPYYDFSNITDRSLLVWPSAHLADQLEKIHKDKSLDIHMKDILLRKMWDILPSDMDCEIEKSLHNISVDADGTIRLCLRIRGVYTPEAISLRNLINNDGIILKSAFEAIKKDKKEYCKRCNHTCQIMSKVINDQNMGPADLVHLDRR